MQPIPKKRKANMKGIATYHLDKFVEAVMDTLVRHEKYGFLLPWILAVNKREYKPLFLLFSFIKSD